jgi:uncharacterized protein YndB with AHSA1/START domain
LKEKILEKEITVKASAEQVWRAWTTLGGVKRFFAPDARLDIRPGGPYEVLFDLDAPPGKQGSELCRVLSFVPGRMLSFSWNAPPGYANARKQLAQWVVILLEPEGESKTRVRLFELGWKKGKEGEAVYKYFDRAWNTVLHRLAYSFEEGAIDWKNPWRPSE